MSEALFPHAEGYLEAAGVIAHVHAVLEGTALEKHQHPYDHISILAQGCAVVTLSATDEDEEETHVMTAGQCITTRAGRAHKVFAATDIIWYCIHPKEVQ